MSPTVLHDAKRSLFIMVPPKGPLSMLLRVGEARQVYEALRPLRESLVKLRGDRPSPVLLSLSNQALEGFGEEESLDVLVRALGVLGLNCVGFIEGAPGAERLADMTNLMVVPPAEGVFHVDLLAHAHVADKKALRDEEAQAWEEALTIDAQINRERELRDWEEAIEEDALFEARKEAERQEAERLKQEEAKAWEEAIIIDELFNREQEAQAWVEAEAMDAQINQERELRDWEQALEEEARREEARQAALRERMQRLAEEAHAWDEAIRENVAFDRRKEARDWDEAIAYDALIEQAEAAARQARQAVLEGKAAAVPAPSSQEAMVATQASFGGGEEEYDAASSEGDAAVAVAPEAATVATARVHRDRVRSGCQIYAQGTDLTVFGNVSSGAEIIADGSIHAYAPVYGRVIAGAQGNKDANIVCRQFFAELVAVGGVFLTSEDLPEDIRGSAVHFWNEDGMIHFRRLPEAAPTELAL